MTKSPHVVNLYGIKDAATGCFGGVIEQGTDQEVVRSLRHHLMADVNTLYAQAPADFSLWRLGSVDKQTGMFISDQEMICSLSALVEAPRAVSVA